MKNTIVALSLLFALSACKYSNTFQGSFNGTPALLDAYSKNINKYCVSLTLNTGDQKKSTFISAQDVFDANDIMKPMMFNTKAAQCGSTSDEYMVGSRSTKIIGTGQVTVNESYGVDYCRNVTYNRYDYQEEISIEFRKRADDSFSGTFKGMGMVASYTDRDHPVNYGPIFYCGMGYPRPYPGPGPWPYPGPGPWPRNFPGGWGGWGGWGW